MTIEKSILLLTLSNIIRVLQYIYIYILLRNINRYRWIDNIFSQKKNKKNIYIAYYM